MGKNIALMSENSTDITIDADTFKELVDGESLTITTSQGQDISIELGLSATGNSLGNMREAETSMGILGKAMVNLDKNEFIEVLEACQKVESNMNTVLDEQHMMIEERFKQ